MEGTNMVSDTLKLIPMQDEVDTTVARNSYLDILLSIMVSSMVVKVYNDFLGQVYNMLKINGS